MTPGRSVFVCTPKSTYIHFAWSVLSKSPTNLTCTHFGAGSRCSKTQPARGHGHGHLTLLSLIRPETFSSGNRVCGPVPLTFSLHSYLILHGVASPSPCLNVIRSGRHACGPDQARSASVCTAVSKTQPQTRYFISCVAPRQGDT